MAQISKKADYLQYFLYFKYLLDLIYLKKIIYKKHWMH